MPSHHITDLKIENFRGFKSLELNGLKSVNLIVGENNTGKTSLLEALVLGSGTAYQLFSNSQEYIELLRESTSTPESFFKWMKYDESNKSIQMKFNGKSIGTWIFEGDPPEHGIDLSSAIPNQNYVNLNLGNVPEMVEKVSIIQSKNAPMQKLVTLVGSLLRKKNGEEILYKVLTKIDKRYQKTRIDPILPNVVTVSVSLGHSELIPLNHTGQGFYRVIQILSELVASDAKICIIDEIENGIHYSALPQLWRGIAELSKQLNVQVFVATHSRDCIEAAYQAMTVEDQENKIDFGVVQLYRVDGEIEGRVLGEKHVEMAMHIDSDLR